VTGFALVCAEAFKPRRDNSLGTILGASKAPRYRSMMDEAAWNRGSKALWSTGDSAVQRARTTEDFPKRSSLMRETGVLDDNIAVADVTDDALSSIAISIRSFGSRTRKTSVSTMSFESTLNEYWTLLKGVLSGNSRRTRTQSADETAAAGNCSIPGMGVFGSRVECPRATSKSLLNAGFGGTLASAADNSFCSSADGAQTLSTRTLTGGCGELAAGGCAAAVESKIIAATQCRFFCGNTAKLYQAQATGLPAIL